VKKSEVRIPDTAPRKRGGQPGNRNRLRHGRYAATTIERRKEVAALGRLARHALTRVKMILRARKALKRARIAPPRQPLRCHGPRMRATQAGSAHLSKVFEVLSQPTAESASPGWPAFAGHDNFLVIQT
jgi:hypothetical protein